jgi:DNA-binding XRE family transcriptional regulator
MYNYTKIGAPMPITTISGKQCAAGRAIVGWSQDELAKNAGVARATIAGFEGNTRIEPASANLRAIIASLEQAGIAFIPEDVENGLGAGVRQRKLELEYSSTLRTALRQEGWDLVFPVRYKGRSCTVTISREIIDDIARGNFRTTDEQVKVVQNRLPEFLKAVETRLAGAGTVPDRMTLAMEDFPPGTF